MNKSAVLNRSYLIDAPIIETLITNKYKNAKITFIKNYDSNLFDSVKLTCIFNGNKKHIYIKRNTLKYKNSNEYVLHFNKNDLTCFNNSIFTFIDETNSLVYFIDGIDLLKFMLNNQNKICINKNNKAYFIVSKDDLANKVSSISDHIIKYNETIAKMLNLSENEFDYTNL